jgi:hypothetical protein
MIRRLLPLAALGLAAVHCGAPPSTANDATSEDVTGATHGVIRPVSAPSMCLAAASSANGAAVTIEACDGSASQAWTYDGKALEVLGAKCLDVTGGSTANGAKLQVWDCVTNGTNANQKWTRSGSTFQWTGKGKCVDLTGGATDAGTPAQSWSCSSGNPNQQWTFDAGTSSAPDAGASPPPGGFVHPGVLSDAGQLDFVKARIAAGAEPWKSALASASGSHLGSLSYQPTPFATVECGPYSNPDVGCSQEKSDAAAAYTHALLWYLTGQIAHAQTAIRVLDAWSSTVKSHTNSNAPLQSAWVAEVFPRAAEILRYTDSGWPAASVAQFETMLKNVYLPEVVNGSDSNGNWELSMIEATMNIAVFTGDHATFDKAVAMWRRRVPAYVYMTSDGATPVPPPGPAKSPSQLTSFWYGQTTFVDGVAQETCRDLGHAQYGLAAMINAAETARIQGVDLFGEQAPRLAAALELHAQFLDGAAVPSWLCGGKLNAVSPDPMWEIALNALARRRGMSLPKTQELVNKIRPTQADHHMDWETLTHAEIGAVGL